MLGIKPQKSPKLKLSPPLSPNSGFFWGLNHKNSQTLYHPRPRSIPKMFLGIFVEKTQKTPNLNLSSPPKNPQKWSKGLPHPRPVPEIRGGDGENRGWGPRFTTLINVIEWQNRQNQIEIHKQEEQSGLDLIAVSADS